LGKKANGDIFIPWSPFIFSRRIMAQQKLPTALKPTNYKVTLIPDLHTFEFKGFLQVELTAQAKTNTIIANAKDLTVSDCYIVVDHLKSKTKLTPVNINHCNKREEVTFTFDADIPAGSKVTLYSEFIGIHNDKMVTFIDFRLDFIDRGIMMPQV
jgi:hypothetical protein